MKLLGVATAVLFAILLTQVFNIQVINGASFFKTASQNFIQRRAIVAERGLIKDRNGVILAQSQPNYRLVVKNYSQLNINDFSEKLYLISSNLDLSFEDLQKKCSEGLKTSATAFVLAANLSKDQALKAETLLSSSPFFQIEMSPVRLYEGGEAFSHIVGYVGQVSQEEFAGGSFSNYLLGEVTGKEGLEKSFEEKLRGSNGLEIVEINAQGEGAKILSRKEPERGGTLNLTIDSALQQEIYKILSQGAMMGSVIVSNVQNGDILAAVNYPSFNNNVFIEADEKRLNDLLSDPQKPLFNRFLNGQYPPGSTFKLVMAVAALDEGVIDENTLLEAPGVISQGSFTYKDWKPEGQGLVNIVTALAKSADTFFYQLGGGYKNFTGLGVERIYKWAKAFNLGKKTGIDLPSESEGLVPNEAWKKDYFNEPWYIGNTYHLSIGQGDLLATPLQVNLYTNIVASGGRIYKPNLVQGSEVFKGQVDADPSVFSTIKEGLIKACSVGGTAYPLFSYAGRIACKTGTSETSIEDKTHAWLTMFYPPDNSQYSITVFLEHGGGGAQDAAPIAKEIYDYMIGKGI
ncbi:MAG: penicillin-binding protein 2 [bacterium]